MGGGVFMKIPMYDVFSSSSIYSEISQAIVACEREFNVEVLVHLDKITEPKREGEYIGREVPASAEWLRRAMADFCHSQVPECKFDFWKFTVELSEPDEKPDPVLFTE